MSAVKMNSVYMHITILTILCNRGLISTSNVTHDPLGNQTLTESTGVVQVGSMSWLGIFMILH
jgi:hypothetical protein